MIKRTLLAMNRKLQVMEGGGDIIKAGETGSLTNDEELRADRELGNVAIEILKTVPVVRTIEVEGFGKIVLANKNGTIDAKIDSLDASLNYQNQGNLNNPLPFSGVITYVSSMDNPTFDDVLEAGVMNFASSNPDFWYAQHLKHATTINSEIAQPYQGELDLLRMPVIAEMYYPENRERIVEAFAGMKGYLRNPGSAAVEMSFVASGNAAAFICDRQKGHELGAAYCLIHSAGGVIWDWDGNDFGEKPYVFNHQYPVIAASNERVAEQILELLHKTK